MATEIACKFGVNHLGIVVRDVEKTAKVYEDVFGMGPFNVVLRDVDKIELHGEPAEVRLKSALAFHNGIQIELVEVVEGKSVHKEFLDAGNEGLHHLGVYVDDFAGELAKYRAKGYEVLSQGKAYGVARWAYVDARADLGLIWELIEMPPRKSARRRQKRGKKSEE